MLGNSRLAIFAFTFLFFLAGAWSAYARCFDDWREFHSQTQLINADKEESHSDAESLHCPENVKAYATGQASDFTKSASLSGEAANNAPLNCLKPETHPHLSPGHSLSPFPYRSVPIYKLNAVYRI